MNTLRYLTVEGIAKFEAYLESLRTNPTALPPVELLETPGASGDLDVAYQVDRHSFDSKLEMARYIRGAFPDAVKESSALSRGVWAWLSLFWLDQLLPPDPNSARSPNKLWYYLPSGSHYTEYRHLLLGPYRTYRSSGDGARLLLCGPVSNWSDVEEQLASKREFLRLPGALAAADLLYFDAKKGRPRLGCTNRKKPGTIRRLLAMTKQFALTYDLHSMTGSQVASLLPSEFDRFRS